MKKIATTLFLFTVFLATAQVKIPPKDTQIVEASCGQCQFGLKGKGCNLAVRIDGKAYFVDGTSIDEHGDAHGADGFCEAVRKAEVSGELVKNRYQVTFFKVLPTAQD
jgi:hypothetical protein